MWNSNTNKIGSTTLKELTTPDSRNTPSTTNLEAEETVDSPGNNGNASMPEQVERPNPWRKKMMMMTNNELLHVDLMILYHQAGIRRTLNTNSFLSCR